MSTNAFGLPADETTDASPDLTPATFDLSAWVGGVTSTVRSVTLHSRADLLADADDLERQLRIAESIPAEDRALGDPGPARIRTELERVAREFEASALVFKVQGRSDDAREKIAKRLKKQGVTDDVEVMLHQLADAIIEPAGVSVEFLRALGEKSEPQLKMLVVAAQMANTQVPRVDVPFSSGSSSDRKRPPRS